MYTWGYIKDAALAKLDLDENEATVQNLLSRFPFYANEVITQVTSAIKPKASYASFEITSELVNVEQIMPKDFVSFGDDICWMIILPTNDHAELHDTDFGYRGYNHVVFYKEGIYEISYNARWITFDKNMDDNFELDIPTDILDCIPSYIASQCYKIDDEYKASVFRQEYELMLARIDNTNYKNTKTFVIEGGW